jgi:hypothetical protein
MALGDLGAMLGPSEHRCCVDAERFARERRPQLDELDLSVGPRALKTPFSNCGDSRESFARLLAP